MWPSQIDPHRIQTFGLCRLELAGTAVGGAVFGIARIEFGQQMASNRTAGTQDKDHGDVCSTLQ